MNRDRPVVAPFTRLAVLLVVLAITCFPALGQGIITTLGHCGTYPDIVCAATNTVVDAAGNIYFARFNQIGMVNPAGVVTMIAGTAGQMGTTGDGGPALSAKLGQFYQIALYGSRLCFGDATAYRIRCVDLGTGLIQGYGTGWPGTGGDGGNVSAASFRGLWGAAFDNQGILYVSDDLASSVRRVDFTTGIITMFAGPGPGGSGPVLGDGGPALGANIYQPEGLAYGNGSLYIADTGNLRIRQVDLATGLIATAAGNGSAVYLPANEGGSAVLAGISPSSMATDTTGNLFLLSSCCTIRQVDTAGIITTVAGASGVVGDGLDDIPATETVFRPISGLGWDPVATRLLISDVSRLRQIFYTPPTTTTLTASENPAHWGETVTFTAVVSPPDATGSVRFYVGNEYQTSLLLGSAPITNGSATFSWTAFAFDVSATMTAVYGGDFTHNLSQSTMSWVVNSGSSSTSLSSSPNPSASGQSVTLTATVSPAGATGSVTFVNNGTTLGTSPIVAGNAVLIVSTLPGGSNFVTASYSGDSRYTGSMGAVYQVVNKTSTTTVLSSSSNPSTAGSSVVLSAIVSPNTATGMVQFMEGATSLGLLTVNNKGEAYLPLSNLSVGTHSITAFYYGDANDLASASAALVQVVNRASSSTTLASSPNPSTVGQSVTLTATIAPASAYGTVTFSNNGSTLGTSDIMTGTALLIVSNLPPGSNSIIASYSGDSRYAGSTSPAVTQVINKTSTTTVLSSSANPSAYGGSLVLSAIVSPPRATGTVQFMEGATLLGTATVDTMGGAYLSLSSLSVGTHSITAVYSGDSNFLASTSAALAQVVNKASSTVTLASSANPSTVGQSVTLTAVLSPASATGTVQFLDDSTMLGTATITSGSATLAVSLSAAGAHSLTAVYSGDGNYTSSTATLKQTVNKGASSVVLTSSQNPSPYGTNIQLSATVTPGSATGSIQFLDGPTLLGTAVISGGPPTMYISTLSVGPHAITAVYGGDANDEGSTSAVVTQTVNKDASSVTVASSLNPAAYGQPVTFSADVTPSVATGTVQFLDGSTVLGTVTVNKETAFLTPVTLTAGTHMISVAYSGDSNDNASTSAILTQTVNKAVSNVVLTSSQNPSLSGTSISFSAAVTPGSATGSVRFLDGSALLGTAVISGGSATMNISTLTAGSHNITAVYGGDANDAGSTSGILTQTVKANSSLSLVSSLNPSAYGQTVTFTVTVSPSSATGTVQVREGSTTLGTVTLNGGSAALPVSGLAPGSHYLVGLYNGDANTGPSVSPVLTQTVAPPSPSHLTATTVSNSEIDLSWQGVPTSGVLYNVYVSTVPIIKPSPSNLYGGYPAPPLTVLRLQPATTYYFLVTAALSGGESAPANPASATTLPATVVVLTSSRNPSTEGQAVTFRAKVSPAAATGTVRFMDGSTTFATVPLAGGVASATISTLSAGGHSIYAAYSGNVQYGPITVVMAQNVFPDPPSHLTAVAVSPTQINLSWQASPTSGVTYNVYSSATPGFTPSAATIIGGGSSSTTFSDTNLPPSTTRYYLVTAALPTGQSASNQASARTLPLTAPSHLTATAVSASQIDLSWQASPTSGVTYKVYSSATPGFAPSASNLIESGGTVTRYFDAGLAPSTTRYYLVTAALSGAESTPSNQASARTAHR